MEVRYKEMIEQMPKIYKNEPGCVLGELALFKDITLEILLIHYDKYPGIKMSGFGVEALQSQGKHEIVEYLKDHGLLRHWRNHLGQLIGPNGEIYD